jgi:hypothetical protein
MYSIINRSVQRVFFPLVADLLRNYCGRWGDYETGH